IVGVVAGWVTAPGESDNKAPQYRATHTLILAPTINSKVFNIDQAALLVTTGVIPQNVATKLGAGTDPVKLAKKISATSNAPLGTLDVTATDVDPNYAVALADDFAQGLVDDLSQEGLQRWQAQHDTLQTSVTNL